MTYGVEIKGAFLMDRTFNSLIVGFGRAGRSLHLVALSRLAETGVTLPIGVVEPQKDLHDRGRRTAHSFLSLVDAHIFKPDETVVHICSPPLTHLAVIAEAASLGYRKLIVEKPMVTSEEELLHLSALVERYGLELLVVSNWTSSVLTTMVQQEIAARACTGVVATEVSIRQVKPRIERNIEDTGEVTVFDIEMPHMFALSALLAGDEMVRLVDATSSDMDVCGVYRPHLATSDVTLATDSGLTFRLHSNLLSPRRERSIKVAFSDGTSIVGYFPCSEADSYSQLVHYDREGVVVVHRLCFDDTLVAFFADAYAYFAGVAAKPRSDYAFHVNVCRLLAQARLACGITTPEDQKSCNAEAAT